MIEYPIDVVIDTDTFNEVDDQFALVYLLKNQDRLSVQAIYAAPFQNEKASSPKIGMQKSREEIFRLLDLMGLSDDRKKVYDGAGHFLNGRKNPVSSPAAENLVQLALRHTGGHPLYVIGIAAATDIASALLLEPQIRDRIVVVWLGGSGYHCADMEEFNLMEDIAAAQVLFESGVRLVQVPCWGVAEYFTLSRPEFVQYLLGKNKLADHLASYAIKDVDSWAKDAAWAKAIWDVTAVAWLLNEEERFLKDRFVPAPGITDAGTYDFSENRHQIRYVYRIERDALMTELLACIVGGDEK
jgi:hypothetical protein